MGKLIGGNALQQTSDAYYVTEYDTLPDGSLLPRIVKLDYASAREELFYALETPVLQFGEPLVRGSQLYFVADQTLYRIPLDGGEVAEFPVPAEFIGFSAADEYSAFCFYPRADGLHGDRLDLETGQITALTLPPQTEMIYPVGERPALFSTASLPTHRCPTPAKTLKPTTPRCRTPARSMTGSTLPPGNWKNFLRYRTTGRNSPTVPGAAGCFWPWRTSASILYGASKIIPASWSKVLKTATSRAATGSKSPCRPKKRFITAPLCAKTRELRWIRNWTAGGDYRIYDLSTGENHSIPSLRELPGTETARPEALTGDGRCLLRTNYLDAQGGYRNGYALIDQADYLAGSTAWTPIQPYTG